MPKLREDPKRFYLYFRMTLECFDEVLDWIHDEIIKMPTNFRVPIPPQERLALTLRYFFNFFLIILTILTY